MVDKPLIFDLDIEDLEAVLSEWGEPSYRARQIWHGLYQQLWDGPYDFSTLPLPLREKLAGYFSFRHLTPERAIESSDGLTRKTLFRLPDGQAIEAVLMRYDSTSGARERRTLCISSQAGCAMGCVFCATGQMGFRRHLTSGEIVEQVIYYARRLQDRDKRVTNVVLMGI